jgi:hypothetical protein
MSPLIPINAVDKQRITDVHKAIITALYTEAYQEIDAESLIDLIRAGKIPHVTITY